MTTPSSRRCCSSRRSVIIGMHHDQDIRNMGGVRRFMPVTYLTALLGSWP